MIITNTLRGFCNPWTESTPDLGSTNPSTGSIQLAVLMNPRGLNPTQIRLWIEHHETDFWVENATGKKNRNRIWADIGGYGQIWADIGRYRRLWADIGRYGRLWADMLISISHYHQNYLSSNVPENGEAISPYIE